MWKAYERAEVQTPSLEALVTTEAWLDARFAKAFLADRRSAVEGLLARKGLDTTLSPGILESLTLQPSPVGYVRDPAIRPVVSPGTVAFYYSSDSACITEGICPGVTDDIGCPGGTIDPGCETSDCTIECPTTPSNCPTVDC